MQSTRQSLALDLNTVKNNFQSKYKTFRFSVYQSTINGKSDIETLYIDEARLAIFDIKFLMRISKNSDGRLGRILGIDSNNNIVILFDDSRPANKYSYDDFKNNMRLIEDDNNLNDNISHFLYVGEVSNLEIKIIDIITKHLPSLNNDIDDWEKNEVIDIINNRDIAKDIYFVLTNEYQHIPAYIFNKLDFIIQSILFVLKQDDKYFLDTEIRANILRTSSYMKTYPILKWIKRNKECGLLIKEACIDIAKMFPELFMNVLYPYDCLPIPEIESLILRNDKNYDIGSIIIWTLRVTLAKQNIELKGDYLNPSNEKCKTEILTFLMKEYLAAYEAKNETQINLALIKLNYYIAPWELTSITDADDFEINENPNYNFTIIDSWKHYIVSFLLKSKSLFEDDQYQLNIVKLLLRHKIHLKGLTLIIKLDELDELETLLPNDAKNMFNECIFTDVEQIIFLVKNGFAITNIQYQDINLNEFNDYETIKILQDQSLHFGQLLNYLELQKITFDAYDILDTQKLTFKQYSTIILNAITLAPSLESLSLYISENPHESIQNIDGNALLIHPTSPNNPMQAFFIKNRKFLQLPGNDGEIFINLNQRMVNNFTSLLKVSAQNQMQLIKREPIYIGTDYDHTIDDRITDFIKRAITCDAYSALLKQYRLDEIIYDDLHWDLYVASNEGQINESLVADEDHGIVYLIDTKSIVYILHNEDNIQIISSPIPFTLKYNEADLFTKKQENNAAQKIESNDRNAALVKTFIKNIAEAADFNLERQDLTATTADLPTDKRIGDYNDTELHALKNWLQILNLPQNAKLIKFQSQATFKRITSDYAHLKKLFNEFITYALIEKLIEYYNGNVTDLSLDDEDQTLPLPPPTPTGLFNFNFDFFRKFNPSANLINASAETAALNIPIPTDKSIFILKSFLNL